MELALETMPWTLEMAVSGVILLVTFVGIFTEGIHGIHRVKSAMLGAGMMIVAGQICGFYDPRLAVEAVDWNIVFLLGCMMTIVAIMIPTGGFQIIAYRAADFSRGRLFLLLAALGTLVTVLSLLLDNVTTVVIFGPLIVLICQALDVSPVPFLLAAALLSDTGGVATLVGDPPNLMIGSAAGISFNAFLKHMGGIVLVAWVTILASMKLLFRRELSVTPRVRRFAQGQTLTDVRTWYAALAVLAFMSVLFIFHDALEWEPWFVSALGLSILLFLGHRVNLDRSFERVEITLLVFFICLFIVVGGVIHSQFLHFLGQGILPFVGSNLLESTLLLMWMAAILSALIDNIPFTAAMVPIILSMEQHGVNVTPLWWGLAIGVGMGGNGTHLGSTANVFIVTLSERIARDTGNPALRITPGMWFRKGTPAMLLTLTTSSALIWLFFDFFSAPVTR